MNEKKVKNNVSRKQSQLYCIYFRIRSTLIYNVIFDFCPHKNLCWFYRDETSYFVNTTICRYNQKLESVFDFSSILKLRSENNKTSKHLFVVVLNL